ncbi:MAG TPA: hypothetical protein VFB26_12445 [Gaiellaceae bacterium]|nr:hypothetical protein [Gaiellaceae bacterium]
MPWVPGLSHLAYPGLFVLVAAESAGVPVPGETALVAASLLTAAGRLSLPLAVLAGVHVRRRLRARREPSLRIRSGARPGG